MNPGKNSVNTNTLAGWLTKKMPVTILDIRPKPEREEWSIPGSIHADVYEKLKKGHEHALDHMDLDPQKPIVTVCGAGRVSLKAAEWLRRNGFDAVSLEGGMKAWNFAWNTAEVAFGDFKIIQIRRSVKGCLSYLVGSGNEGVVIDASLDPKVYEDLARGNRWKISYVMDTHIHADYISRTRELAAASGARHILIEETKVNFPFHPVSDGDTISFGHTHMSVLHTPGHTLESTTFGIAGFVLFTGDTLFNDGVGRPDLKADRDESLERCRLLYHSLEKLLKKESSTLVLPAHSSKAVPFDRKLLGATVAELRNKLDILKLDEPEFVRYTLDRIPPTPPNYLTIAALNKKGLHLSDQPAELEAGANHCAVR